jgi:hypothetical protein
MLHTLLLSVQNALHVLEISTNSPPLRRWLCGQVGGVFSKIMGLMGQHSILLHSAAL